jgi:purine nucleosidase
MIDAARRYGGRLTIVATGPLSNLATALMRSPEAMTGVGQLVVMGGALGRGNVNEYAEFNLLADPHAAKRVLTAALPKVVIPLETCALLPADQDFVRRIRATRGELANIVADLLAERIAMNGGEAVSAYDVLAALFLIEADLFRLQHGKFDVEAGKSARLGKLYFDPGAQDAESTLAASVDKPAAYSLICDVLSRA